MSHIYSDAVSRVKELVRRNGLGTVLAKPFRVALAPLIISRLPKRTFSFQGQQLAYFFHRYNTTWINERCVEIPIARNALAGATNDSILEIGNVIRHYQPVTHDVLDKYEVGPSVINADICDFQPSRRYAVIVSVSTFEHVGFDDTTDSGSAEKIQTALETTRSWLQPDGRFTLTAPLGYNPHFDALVRQGLCAGADLGFMRRVGRSEWRECDADSALEAGYSRPWPYGNAIVVAGMAAT